jgi:ATP-dependent Lon protease
MVRPNPIPLFPLDVVLLPGMHLPLHIFEPRYQLMITRCIREKLEFGMILASDKAVATFGCTAEILSTVRDYPDGRTDIVTEGRSVFRLIELLDLKEYYEGAVEYLGDIPSPADPEKEAQLLALFEQCHQILFGRPWGHPALNEPATLAYHMGALLPMELQKRQALLESRSESDRRELVLAWLTLFLPKLAERQRARNRAGGNGHALN